MTERTLPTRPVQAGTPWESYFVLGSVTLLSGLAVADRLTAWLIGAFPTYALFWRMRFEFLRPIGVYYDMVERQIGTLSPATFSALALLAAVIIAAGVISRIRLARAISCHLVLLVACLLGVMSWDPGIAVRAHTQVGMTSQPYAFLGFVLAATAAVLCLRIHAEYAGWNPASSRLVRRARIISRRVRSTVGVSAADLVDQITPMPAPVRLVFAAVNARRARTSVRQR